MNLGHYLDLSVSQALAVIVSTAAMYLLLVVLLHVWGQRLIANPSSRTTATVVVLGAVVGRASLGIGANLEGGALCLATLLLMMLLVELGGPRTAAAHGRAEALVVAGEVRHDALARHHLSESALWSHLRHAGHGTLADVALALLEPSGEVSVIPTGARLDREAVGDVRDGQSLPASLFRQD